MKNCISQIALLIFILWHSQQKWLAAIVLETKQTMKQSHLICAKAATIPKSGSSSAPFGLRNPRIGGKRNSSGKVKTVWSHRRDFGNRWRVSVEMVTLATRKHTGDQGPARGSGWQGERCWGRSPQSLGFPRRGEQNQVRDRRGQEGFRTELG